MKSPLILLLFILVIQPTFSQHEIRSIKIPTRSAHDFRYFENKNNTGCFFINMKTEYCFILVDSAFNAIKTYKNSFYTSLQPEFIGSSSSNDRFSIYFKLYEDDKFLVYIIDLNSLDIRRTKEFRITSSKTEKVLSARSYNINTEFIAFTYDENKVYVKNILPELKIKSQAYAISDSLFTCLERDEFVYLRTVKDSLLLVGLKNSGLAPENENYLVFSIKQSPFDSYHYTIRRDNKCKESNAKFLLQQDTFLLSSCDEIKFFDLYTGNFLKKTEVDLETLIQNAEIPLLKYTMEENPITLKKSFKLEKLRGSAREELMNDFEHHYYIIEKDSGIYLNTLSVKSGYDVQYLIKSILMINMKDLSISYKANPAARNTYMMDSILFSRKNIPRTSAHGLFKDAAGKKYLGYLDKRRKSFVIETIEL